MDVSGNGPGTGARRPDGDDAWRRDCAAPQPENATSALAGAGCAASPARGGRAETSGGDQNEREPTMRRDQLPGWMPSALIGVATSHLHGCMNSV